MDIINKEIQRRQFEGRKGNMVADGFMWCPNCGTNMVSNGHRTCEACDKTIPMSMDDFRKLHAENLKKSSEILAKKEPEPVEIKVDEEDESEEEPEEESEEEVVSEEEPTVVEKPKATRRRR